MSETTGFRVALTFDAEHPDRPACPEGNTDRILDTLVDRGVRATFFLQGRWAESQPTTATRIARDGHLIGHHSFYHARMPLLSAEGLRADVEAGFRAIVDHAGADPRPWFRCPFGAGHDQDRVLEGLQALGYRNVHWHVALDDWEPWRTGPAITGDALREIAGVGDGAVVLLHSWPAGTGDAVGPLIDGLRSLGAVFRTVDELDALP